MCTEGTDLAYKICHLIYLISNIAKSVGKKFELRAYLRKGIAISQTTKNGQWKSFCIEVIFKGRWFVLEEVYFERLKCNFTQSL